MPASGRHLANGSGSGRGDDGVSSAIVVVVCLFVRPGQETTFRRFEMEAARVMRRYGGRIDRVIRPTDSSRSDVLPREIHVVSFPSLERFEAYRGDRELADLAPLRETAIHRTEITIGKEARPYA